MKYYNLKPGEILDKIFGNEKKGFTPKEMEKLEKNIKYKLPSQLYKYYVKYGNSKINVLYHNIRPPGKICFSFDMLDNELENLGETDFIEFYKKSIHEVKNEAQNYLMFWHENQGAWNAGITEDDLKNGIENPKVYITTSDNFTKWKCLHNTVDSFLLAMIIENVKENNGFFENTGAVYDIENNFIKETIKKFSIDITKLKQDYSKIITCLDDEKKKFMYF